MPSLGVVGTLVWDRIHRPREREMPVEEWGGIAYGLAALAASLPEDWTVRPILKVGRDRAEDAFRFLGRIPRLEDSGVVVVPERNNFVELHYRDEGRRTEILHGGVPGWSWPELAPQVELCDALYLNFISGFEMSLETAQALRRGYDGPLYADLHSLFLGITGIGERVPQELAGWAEWLRCFDAVQMNEDEFELLGAHAGDPWHLAAAALGPDLKLLAVTLGERGAAYVAGADFRPDPGSWRAVSRLRSTAPARSGRVPVEGALRTGDPTGCGDVWGATFFAGLLAGQGLEASMRDANRLASRNVEHRGARGLHRFLEGRLPLLEDHP